MRNGNEFATAAGLAFIPCLEKLDWAVSFKGRRAREPSRASRLTDLILPSKILAYKLRLKAVWGLCRILFRFRHSTILSGSPELSPKPPLGYLDR